MSDPQFDLIIIEVQVNDDGQSFTLHKPDWEIRNRSYSLDGQDIRIGPLGVSSPLAIELTVVTEGYVIDGIGFGVYLFPLATPVPTARSTAGPCGGCFELLADAGTQSIRVLDNFAETDASVYAYNLALRNVRTGRRFSYDPRIYNRGKLDRPGWFRRLVAWLRRLFARAHRGR